MQLRLSGREKKKGKEEKRSGAIIFSLPSLVIIGFGSKKGAVPDFHRLFLIFAPHMNWRILSAIFRFVPSLLSFLFFLRSAFVSFNYCLHSFPIFFLSFSAQLNFTHAANGIESLFRCFFPLAAKGFFSLFSPPPCKELGKGLKGSEGTKRKGEGGCKHRCM